VRVSTNGKGDQKGNWGAYVHRWVDGRGSPKARAERGRRGNALRVPKTGMEKRLWGGGQDRKKIVGSKKHENPIGGRKKAAVKQEKQM